MKIKALVAGVALVAAGGQAVAATDGTYGATSQGQAIITATVGNMVRISAVQDVTLTAGGGWTAAGAACVFNNQGTNYTVTVTGSNDAAGVYYLAGPDVPQSYTVNWNGAPLIAGAPLAGASGATQVADCGGVGNTNATYTVSAAGSIGVLLPNPGVYTDTVTLLVGP